MFHSQNSSSRRQWMQASTLTLGATLVAAKLAQADPLPRKKLLFFNRSAGFEHSVVKRDGRELSYAERQLTELGKKYNFEVVCTKDGGVFDSEYKDFDGYFFYTTEDLTKAGKKEEPPMSEQGKKNFLEAVSEGKGFVGSHCASDTFHSPGDRKLNSEKLDPYIAMLGGEFIRHGRQQVAKMRIADKKFPGLSNVSEDFSLNEEWYSLKNFAPDLHVILVQETEGMVDADYQRPPYPATWARKHGKGRVFYTSMGHREDVWTNPTFESILVGGIDWALGRVEAEVPANIAEVTPQASTMPKL